MASGMMAIRQDQSLAWNSLKQLENDFLLYGKYNVAQLQDIVSTVNGLQNRSRTMQLERLLTGQDMFTLQMGTYAPRCFWKDDIYSQNELVCSQCA